MSKRKCHKKNTSTTQTELGGWPQWFALSEHPVEKEVLLQILEKNDQISTAFVIVQMMQINYMVFARNHEELVNLQNNFNKPLIFNALALNTIEGKNIAGDATLEYTRLLHNFLASAKMLVDTTRRWVEKTFAETEFKTIYQHQIEKCFVNNTQAQFLENLRNFTLHRILPVSKHELRMSRINEHTMQSSLGIVLDKKQLLKWEGWSELGRLQIQFFQNDNIYIQEIVQLYFDNVTEFSKWLFWQIREIFDPEITHYNSVLEKLRQGSRK